MKPVAIKATKRNMNRDTEKIPKTWKEANENTRKIKNGKMESKAGEIK